MNIASLITVLLASTFVLITTGDVPPAAYSLPAGGCADSVISFSPCLPYISAPPNDLSDDPSSQCCDIFTGAFDSGEVECLCYLVRQNTLLGFPVNVTKLISLSDLCSVKNNTLGSHANNTNASIKSICLDSPTLPPLISTIPNKRPRSGSNTRRSPPAPPTTVIISAPTNDESTRNTTQHNGALTDGITLVYIFLVFLIVQIGILSFNFSI